MNQTIFLQKKFFGFFVFEEKMCGIIFYSGLNLGDELQNEISQKISMLKDFFSSLHVLSRCPAIYLSMVRRPNLGPVSPNSKVL